MEGKIDFIITWVDGNDSAWQQSKKEYDPIESKESNNGTCRYRDWNLLKYWFRAVEKNTPWVNHIFFITCGQVPEFLNVNHSKLRLIDHKDYVPLEYLPTFSSHVIENYMNRIPGLQNEFVYFNDDMFVNTELSPSDFFRDGKPCYAFGTRLNRKPDPRAGAFYWAKYNAAELVSEYYPKKEFLLKHRDLLFNHSYGPMFNALNLLFLPQREMMNIIDTHVAVPILKTTMNEVWEKEPTRMECCGQHRFRDNKDVNQFVFRYWDLMRGNFIPYTPSYHYYDMKTRNIQRIVADIRNGKHSLICLNDTDHCTEFEHYSAMIRKAFAERYPEKSSFER